MPSIELSNCTIHYQEHKPNSADEKASELPLVLLHANPGDSQDYAAVLPTLAKHHHVIAIDWPGYGGASSFKQPLAAMSHISPILFYDVLVELLDALKISKINLIGNSIGGNVAARFAAKHPEKVNALVLVSAGGFTKHNPITKLFCQFQGSRFGLPPQRFAQAYLRKRNPTTNAMLKRAKTAQSTTDAAALGRAMWQSFKTADNDLLSIAKNITTPTLLIFGKYDPVIPTITDGRNAQKCIPHAQTSVFGCGHAAFAEVPEAFLGAVQPFLAAHASA